MRLSDAECRLADYALAFLASQLDADLAVEAAQEVAPETQATGEPPPDVRAMIESLRQRLHQGIPHAL